MKTKENLYQEWMTAQKKLERLCKKWLRNPSGIAYYAVVKAELNVQKIEEAMGMS